MSSCTMPYQFPGPEAVLALHGLTRVKNTHRLFYKQKNQKSSAKILYREREEGGKKKQSNFGPSQYFSSISSLIVRITKKVRIGKILGNKTYNKVYHREVVRPESPHHMLCSIVRF